MGEWECKTLDGLGEEKLAAIRAIAARHGVTSVCVFGSFARGEARADSDLDFVDRGRPAKRRRGSHCLPVLRPQIEAILEEVDPPE
ncbi:MAG: nucleotidyltransferase family protein [Bryobacteraceae bacterium]